MTQYIQVPLFETEKVTLTDIKTFIAKSMEGYGNENCWEIKGEFIHGTYVIAGFLKHGSKEEMEACHYSFLISLNAKGMGRIDMMELEHTDLHSNGYALDFIRKLDRCNAFDEYVIYMEGVKK